MNYDINTETTGQIRTGGGMSTAGDMAFSTLWSITPPENLICNYLIFVFSFGLLWSVWPSTPLHPDCLQYPHQVPAFSPALTTLRDYHIIDLQFCLHSNITTASML